MRAAVKHLELELAEATARGEVGDAATQAAERLALRLFPEAAAGGDGCGGGGGVGDACCRLCGGAVPGNGGATRPNRRCESRQGRGALFLVPSADVERRAATAEAVAAAAAAASSAASAADGNGALESGDVGPGGATKRTTRQSPTRTKSSQTCASTAAGEYLTGDGGHSSPSGAALLRGFGSGVRSLDASLARLEAVASGEVGGLFSESSTDRGFPRGRSASPAGRRPAATAAVQGAWAEAVRELRAQVAGLRRRAEAAEELIEVGPEEFERPIVLCSRGYCNEQGGLLLLRFLAKSEVVRGRGGSTALSQPNS